jgi:hypothetical protein
MAFLTFRCFVKERKKKYFNGIVTKQSGMKEQIHSLGEILVFSYFLRVRFALATPLLMSPILSGYEPRDLSRY